MLQEIAAKYGCLSEDDGVAFRGTYLINPEGVLEHITVNNYGIGRNIDETKRILQATQFVAEHGEVCCTLYLVCRPQANLGKGMCLQHLPKSADCKKAGL